LWASTATVILGGQVDQIPGVPNPFIRVTGGVTNANGAHLRASEGASISCHIPDLIIPNAINMAGFWLIADTLSRIYQTGKPDGSQPNFYNSITGKANVSGQTYLASMNSIICTYGSGVSYFPGTIAGTTNTGGQYI
jgi:hypothetical protein